MGRRLVLLAFVLALGGCSLGLAVTNAPDTLPCAPGKGPLSGC